MRTRPQLENELYQAVKFQDPTTWKKILWQRFGEREINRLELSELEQFVEIVKKEYVVTPLPN